MPDQKPPAIVLALSQKVNGHPIKWREEKSSWVIIFEDGRKIFFDKTKRTNNLDEEEELVKNLSKRRKAK